MINIPSLLNDLGSDDLQCRTAAFSLIGTKPSGEIVAALLASLGDTDQLKLRKNAAIALGKLKVVAAVPVLGEALKVEENYWVRESMLLALGAIGGQDAAVILSGWQARNKTEEDALRKARGKVLGTTATTWQPGAILKDAFFEAPAGLETIAIAEAAQHGLAGLKTVSPGLVALPGLVPAEKTRVGTLRCIYGLRLLVAVNDVRPADTLADVAGRLMTQPNALARWPDWINTTADTLAFRFKVEGRKLERRQLLALLEQVRGLAAAARLSDNPSGYAVELILSLEGNRARLYLKPTFFGDSRFAYRQRDVGASINPVVGACLARLAGPPTGGTVFDPTCGSATLLIERALLDKTATLAGLDISRTAMAAARANVQAARLSNRIALHSGDAQQLDAWHPCNLVIANLPFGIRIGRENKGDITALYAAIVGNIATRLEPDGTALLYTANRTALDAALQAQKKQLHIARQYRCQSGGLHVHIWIVTRTRG